MKNLFSIIFFLILSVSCSKPQVNIETGGEIEPEVIAQQIFSLVNTERENRGLYKLKYDEKLAEVALIHSKNMVKQDFLSHLDPEKRSSQKRVETYYPEMIFGEVGENIGYSQGFYG
ncbi:MAG: CAP domain-containing protein, partial [Desulfobacterales bacterium]|nr:CAP domain-containing protein [Desulfobacterales bacterium]